MTPLEAETEDEKALAWLEILANNTPKDTDTVQMNVTMKNN